MNDPRIQEILAAFLAGRSPFSSDLVDRRRNDPQRPPGMPQVPYMAGAFPPYHRGMDPTARNAPMGPRGDYGWFGTVGPFLPDRLNPSGAETPLPLQNFIRLFVERQAKNTTHNPMIFPPNSPLGKLQRAFAPQQNRRLS